MSLPSASESRPTVPSNTACFFSWSLRILSSIVPPITNLVTWIGLNCPSLWIRSWACSLEIFLYFSALRSWFAAEALPLSSESHLPVSQMEQGKAIVVQSCYEAAQSSMYAMPGTGLKGFDVYLTKRVHLPCKGTVFWPDIKPCPYPT